MHAPADGLHLIVKQDCPTCRLLLPVYSRLRATGAPLTLYSQDDPAFPLAGTIDDRALAHSYHFAIDTVPTLIAIANGGEVARAVGWQRAEWEALTGVGDLGTDLPASRPGCGARNVLPGIAERLHVRYGNHGMTARIIDVDPLSDPIEVAYERDWSDGLPVVPPTPERVWRMLQGTARRPDEIVAHVPPNLTACSVEKVAINAVLAGCKPEYLPVVLAAVEAACLDAFNLHGVLATTYFSSPIVIVNGPLAPRIGMNSGVNALGQGNRANATIGRALQLVVRNIGGGAPGGIDRAVLGYPGKYTFCFAEREADSPWVSLATERGVPAGRSAVTLFAGGGVQGILDQQSRTPESLARSFAQALLAVCHPKLALVADALLVVVPEHARVFAHAGWSKADLSAAIYDYTQRAGAQIVRGADGIAEGMPEAYRERIVSKFRAGGLLIVHAGGTAGMFSAAIGGWAASGPLGSSPVTLMIDEDG